MHTKLKTFEKPNASCHDVLLEPRELMNRDRPECRIRKPAPCTMNASCMYPKRGSTAGAVYTN